MPRPYAPVLANPFDCRWCKQPLHALHLIEGRDGIRLEVPLCETHWRACIGVHGQIEHAAVARARARRVQAAARSGQTGGHDC